MTAQPFDWIDDAADILIPAQNAIAVYFNPQGDVVIRQENAIADLAYDHDVAIIIAPHHVPRLIAALQAMIGATSALAAPAKPSKDPTAAERQRKHRRAKRNGVTAETTVTDRDSVTGQGASDELFDDPTDSGTDK